MVVAVVAIAAWAMTKGNGTSGPSSEDITAGNNAIEQQCGVVGGGTYETSVGPLLYFDGDGYWYTYDTISHDVACQTPGP